ncbi:gluconate:H+ symporter [Georgenia thermotolerans]|uniref:Gluconate transporter n=1 Tax=Georgenia thermotolerans TaxID=527326 RepID=A0A7J5ULV9_9MICO|nr:gluconate:H+ symporter [Georgenia thermotolerans]KAE8763365.1 gluconate transporter [Georgenia thermotolerans]
MVPSNAPGSIVLAAAQGAATAGPGRLILATVLAIAAVVVLITWAKINPFLALMLGSAVLAIVSGFNTGDAVTSFAKGVGDTFGSVGILVALGAIVGKLLIDSGGAAQVVDRIVSRVSGGALPWAMAGAAALVGLPMFFEIGVVLLIPIVLMVARRARVPILLVGIPALAGLSVLHGMVPPHPGPLVAISALKADLGLTLAFGLICAIPTVIIAGPLFGRVVANVGPREITPDSPMFAELQAAAGVREAPGTEERLRRTPGFWVTVGTVLLPVVLMLARAVAEIVSAKGNPVHDVLFVLGTPVVALLLGTLVAMFTMGYSVGAGRGGVADTINASLPPMAGTLLIIAAGGGFKQTLVDSGVGNLIGSWASAAHLSVLLLGWGVAVLIRLATGSATVATITAAGIVAPLAAELSPAHLALLVIAVGSGSLFFSHVNDVGFWMVKQYFGMTVKQTILSWSLMETVISVCGLIFALLLSLVV